METCRLLADNSFGSQVVITLPLSLFYLTFNSAIYFGSVQL